MQIAPKMAETASCFMWSVMIGKSSATTKEPIQLKEDARPLARPRMSSGKISPTMTQVSGAQVKV
jgi:hypothetical protein